MRIVLLAPGGDVGDARSRSTWKDTHVQIISAVAASRGVENDSIDIGPVGAPSRGGRLSRALAGSAIGRNLLRLTPWDGGRRFARAVRRDATASETLRAADLVVALERDAVLAAWNASHRGPHPPRAVFGLAAADAALVRLRA